MNHAWIRRKQDGIEWNGAWKLPTQDDFISDTYELDIVWIIGTEACGGADFENTLAHKEADNELDLIVDG